MSLRSAPGAAACPVAARRAPRAFLHPRAAAAAWPLFQLGQPTRRSAARRTAMLAAAMTPGAEAARARKPAAGRTCWPECPEVFRYEAAPRLAAGRGERTGESPRTLGRRACATTLCLPPHRSCCVQGHHHSVSVTSASAARDYEYRRLSRPSSIFISSAGDRCREPFAQPAKQSTRAPLPVVTHRTRARALALRVYDYY